jgi:small-conductance mechanosensitive channel
MREYWHAFINPLHNTLQHLISLIPRLIIAALLFLFFYGLAVLVAKIIRKSLRQMAHVPEEVRLLIARLAYLGMLAIGLLVALSASNINVTAFVASLGLAGFALGFALKDILENFISGILLLFARPFSLNDQVTVGSFEGDSTYEGTVTAVQIRTTTLRTHDNELIVIPNNIIYMNPVTNHTRLGQRRYMVEFETDLEIDTARVEREALEAVTSNPKVAKSPAPSVQLYRLDSGANTLSWRLYYWAEPTSAVEAQTVTETLVRLKRALFQTDTSQAQPAAAMS